MLSRRSMESQNLKFLNQTMLYSKLLVLKSQNLVNY